MKSVKSFLMALMTLSVLAASVLSGPAAFAQKNAKPSAPPKKTMTKKTAKHAAKPAHKPAPKKSAPKK